MISIMKTTHVGLEKMQEVTSGCWINVVEPDAHEIKTLTDLGIPRDFITYPLDMDERSRAEREDEGNLLIVLRVPYFQGTNADVPYITLPLGIIVKDDYIITVCRIQHEIIQRFADGIERNFATQKRNRFLLQIMLKSASTYLADVRKIDKTVETLEDQLEKSMQNKGVLELLKYKKSLVYFTTALVANESMLERLNRSQDLTMYAEDEDLLEDVMTEYQQAIQMTNISHDILTSMMGAFGSIISNNLNAVMKFLASVTIVLSIPTLISSYFGMNVPLPFEHSPYGHLIILFGSVLISIFIVAFFTKRDWF
ncbi:MAG: magnesium transporter CorA family protein [Anaerolineaceae bacterium]|nr:magnesium transporter CorA family protein [Anaerolineaceae bacterium]